MENTEMDKKRHFNTRSFISTGLLITTMGLPFSGIINHNLGFDGFTVERHFWMSVHNVLGFFFLLFSVWHVVLNRKALWNSLNKAKTVVITREAGYAFLLVTFFTLLFCMHALH